MVSSVTEPLKNGYAVASRSYQPAGSASAYAPVRRLYGVARIATSYRATYEGCPGVSSACIALSTSSPWR